MGRLNLSSVTAALPRGRTLPPDLWRSRHRALVLLLCAHAVLLPGWALMWGHPLGHALEGSLLLSVLACAGALLRPRALAAGSVSVGLVAAAALVVHLGNGHTFLHFHFFVMVAALALYQDWEPFLIAVVVVLAEHGVSALVIRDGVYDDPWSQQHPLAATVVHGFYVLAAAGGSMVSWAWSERERVAAEGKASVEAARVRDSERRLSELLDNSPSLVFVKDLDGRLQRVNPKFAEMHERSAEELVGLTSGDLLARPNPQPLNETDLEVLRTLSAVEEESVLTFPAGPRTLHIVKFPLLDEAGVPYGIAGIANDITDRARAEQALLHQTLHDELTGLPNRRHLQSRAEAALAARRLVGLAFFDLDGFKEVNDSLGHDVGDDLLRQVAARLTSVCTAGETLFRLGGDEFVLLMADLPDEAHASAAAARLLDALHEPFVVAGSAVDVRGSSGVAVGSTQLGSTISNLLRDADTALYEAKDVAPGSLVVFDPSLRERDERRRRLQTDLRLALQHDGGLHLAYQPIVTQDGEVALLEALVRWQHPTEGALAPSEFLPVAAAAGLLPALDRWVIARVCEQRRAWADAGAAVSVSVNITPETVSHGNLVDWVEDSCAITGTDPTGLVLELTETAVLDHPAAASRTLAALRRQGVRIALDDFGTGYSSLSLLRDLPVDIVKIDRSFVHGLVPDSADGVIVRAATDLAHALGMRTVAEGIETVDEWRAATTLGCDLMQGWHIARALDANELDWQIGWLPGPRRSPDSAVPA